MSLAVQPTPSHSIIYKITSSLPFLFFSPLRPPHLPSFSLHFQPSCWRPRRSLPLTHGCHVPAALPMTTKKSALMKRPRLPSVSGDRRCPAIGECVKYIKILPPEVFPQQEGDKKKGKSALVLFQSLPCSARLSQPLISTN